MRFTNYRLVTKSKLVPKLNLSQRLSSFNYFKWDFFNLVKLFNWSLETFQLHMLCKLKLIV